MHACKPPPVLKASLELAKALVPPNPLLAKGPVAGGGVRVLIDASRSMQGFAGCLASRTEYNNALDRVTSSLSVDSVVQFGERAKGSGQVFNTVLIGSGIHCPNFYDRLQNPDYALYKAALDDSSGRTYLYFTDGVQSDWSGRNPGPSIGALDQWLRGGRTLAIIAFRSRFDGQAWSEQAQRMIANVSTAERPFYVFVLAQSDAALNGILQKLPASLSAAGRMIRFGNEAVDCKLFPGNVPKFKSSSTPPWSLIEYTNITPGKSILDYRCDLRGEYPLAGIIPHVSLEYRTWDGKQFSVHAGQAGVAKLAALPPASTSQGSATQLEGRLPKDESTRYGFYAVRVSGEPGVPRPWVDSLSTDTDAQPATFDRTYRLSWLIESLARADLAMRPPAVYGLTIQYR